MPDTPDLDAIRKRAEKATEGPWAVDPDFRDGGADQIVEMSTGRCLTIAFLTSDGNENNGPFIAHARTDIPALIAHIDRLAAARDAANKRAEEAERDAKFCSLDRETEQMARNAAEAARDAAVKRAERLEEGLRNLQRLLGYAGVWMIGCSCQDGRHAEMTQIIAAALATHDERGEG